MQTPFLTNNPDDELSNPQSGMLAYIENGALRVCKIPPGLLPQWLDIHVQ